MTTDNALRTESAISPKGLQAIRHLDYTVLFMREPHAMRHFYETVMGFPVHRTLGDAWIELRIGASILALTRRGVLFDDPSPAPGTLSVQLAFRVAPAEVDDCAAALRAKGVELVHEPKDQPWGHRTLFFRDPDGNVLEIFAEL